MAEGMLSMNTKERKLAASEKRSRTREKGMKCQICNTQFPIYRLEIHHKKPVHTFRDGVKLTIPLLEEVKKPSYDLRKNLMVVCANCHKKIHQKLRMEQKKRRKSIAR
jgi:predicted HNH restriction endonuclease